MPEIRRAYRMLVQKYHPDVNPDPSAAIMIREVNEAYEILSDAQKKIEYDNTVISLDQQQTPITEQRTHRDPRYRKRTTRSAPASTYYTQTELMQRYLPYMLWLCWGGILFAVILFTDKILPPKTIVDDISGIYAVYSGKKRYMYDIVETKSGISIKMYYHGASYFYEQSTVKIDRTPILGIATKVYREDGGSEIFVGIIYRTLAFLPVFLLSTAALGVLFRAKVGFSFSLSIVSGVLLIINLYLIF